MSEQNTANGSDQGSERPGGASGGGERLRDQLGALGERLDQLIGSPEIQDARRKLAQAADDVETKLREAQVGERLEKSVNDLTEQIKHVADTPRGKEIGERLTQAFATLQHDVQQMLESPRGQELRTKVAAVLRDWSGAVEGKPGDKPGASDASNDSSAQPKD